MTEPTPNAPNDPGAVPIPSPEPGTGELLKILLHRWIVLYNPFYFLATLSMLAGIYLIDQGLAAGSWDWTLASMTVLGVLQFYEWCLIGLAAWLTRRGLKRPAVILACLESFLLLDPAFFNQVAAHFEPYDIGVAPFLAALTCLKLLALAAALDLRWEPRALLETYLPLAALTLIPLALDNGWVSADTLVLPFVWLGSGWLLLWIRRRAWLQNKSPLDTWGREVLDRFETTLHYLFPVGLFAHASSWTAMYDVRLESYHFVPLLVAVAWLLRRSASTCLAATIALMCSPPDNGSLMGTAIALGLVYAYRFYEVPRNPWPALGTGLALYLAACSMPWNPPVPQNSVAAVGFLLAFGLWAAWQTRHGLPALPGLVLVGINALRAPLRPMETGIALALFAFVALGLGTWAAHRLAGQPLPELPQTPRPLPDEDGATTDQPPVK